MSKHPTISTCDETPPCECDGYPPLLPPADIDEVDFYLPLAPSSGDGRNESDGRRSWRDRVRTAASRAVNLPPSFCGCEGASARPMQDHERGQDGMLACSLIRATKTQVQGVPEGELLVASSTIVNEHQTGRQRHATPTIAVDRSKPIVIICHGLLSWRNQMLLYHLAAGLTRALDCHTLRFDFTGNGHSGGLWSYGNYDVEQRDLKAVVKFVQIKLGCRVVCVIGHSKGSATALRFAWEQEGELDERRIDEASFIPCFVNLSGRYFVPSMVPSLVQKFTKEQQDELDKRGKFLWTVRGQRNFEVTQEGINERGRVNMSFVQRIKTAAVLTIHGDKDCAVPVENAYTFADVFKTVHEVKIITGADHNFNGLKHMDQLASTVASFVTTHGNKQWIECYTST